MSNDLVNNMTGSCEAPAFPERQGGDGAGGENMSEIKAGHAAVTPDVVGVLN